MKIVAGAQRRGSGTVLLDAAEVEFGSTAESKSHGVALTCQEFRRSPELAIAENTFAGCG